MNFKWEEVMLMNGVKDYLFSLMKLFNNWRKCYYNRHLMIDKFHIQFPEVSRSVLYKTFMEILEIENCACYSCQKCWQLPENPSGCSIIIDCNLWRSRWQLWAELWKKITNDYVSPYTWEVTASTMEWTKYLLLQKKIQVSPSI